ncbi:Maf-like protein [Croceitalea sp. MTPC9]|uniref:Maf family nucleotide pyrophosphatase n=1 Tax=unclassified Croceitalea TaxID=2632280 RepID=UPI002B3DFD92|nr:Maf-like protein [Croceitalea sp. MTPC6]GMN15917.1 Maf-like protein [Croceitalea sp. MTPC9]
MTKNPLVEKLQNHKLILASGSPRRKKFFEDLGVHFEVRIKPVEEVYPKELKAKEIAMYLAELKASVFKDELVPNEILITSDTVVWSDNESLAKANDKSEAVKMLKKLSGQWHDVITAVCFTTTTSQKIVSANTKVKLSELTSNEINYYIETFKPYDKAGAYGIQEWLGTIGIEEIQGSYNNVVGLPTHLVYKTLSNL